MTQLNKTCIVCGQKYHYCYSCPTDLQNPSWMQLFDSLNCKEIFNTLCKHGQGMITNEETTEMLKQCDLSNKENFTDNIKQHIDKIFSMVAVEENVNVETSGESKSAVEPKKRLSKRKVVSEELA